MPALIPKLLQSQGKVCQKASLAVKTGTIFSGMGINKGLIFLNVLQIKANTLYTVFLHAYDPL